MPRSEKPHKSHRLSGPGGGSSGQVSHIAPQDRTMDQQTHTSDVSVSTSAVHKRDREEILPDAPNERTSSDLHTSGSQPGLPSRGGCEDQGTAAGSPLELPATEGARIGEEAHGTVQSVSSGVAETRGGERTILGTTPPVDEATRRFNALKSILSIIYTNHKEVTTIQSKAEHLLWRLDILEKRFDSRPSTVAEQRRRSEVICKCKEIEIRLHALSGEPEPRRLADQDQRKVTGLLEDLREIIFDYQMVNQKEIHDQRCEGMDQAEAAVLNNFRSAQGAEYQHGNRKGCLKGTRETVLDEIELWARDPNKSPIYWLNGLAGSGKTTIAQTISERLFADGQLGATFFCSRDFEDRSNVQLIFPTLAIQLARNDTEFRSRFVRLVQSNPGIAHESLYNQVNRLIAEPLQRSALSTVIVVDALDECNDDETTSAILSVLGRLISEVPKVKFFLTGRPELRIQTGFRLPLLKKVADVFVLHDVEPSLITNDIRLFLKHNFLEMASRRGGLDGWPTDEEVERLCKRAAGLFIYAVATIKFIDKQSGNPRRQLNLLLRLPECTAREGKIMVKPNTTLDSLYTSILQGAFGDDDDPDNDPLVRSVLGAMSLVVNPLSPSSIATLLGLDTEDVFPLLSSAQSLLILQDPNFPVRPFHKSFPDFIVDPNRCTNPRFCVSPPDHHSRLLINCLVLMDRILEKNMCKLPDGSANSDISDLKERIERYINPSLRYACTSWYRHFANGPMTPADAPRITSAIHRFLERKLLFWLEVLSALGTVRDAVDALQAATDWLKESPTLDLVSDCSRFVTGYFEIISASCSHIYHSALLLAPKMSIVRKLYESHVQPLTRVVHGLPVSWDSNTTATWRPIQIDVAAWSSCSRFLAIGTTETEPVEILDSLTLQRLQSLEFPWEIPRGRMALIFSPDDRMLTCAGLFDLNRETFVVSWDLKTGGTISGIRRKASYESGMRAPHIACSINGRVVGVLFQYYTTDFISIYDVVSGVYMHDVGHNIHDDLHSLPRPRLYNIWTHGESLRFVIVEQGTCTIWEVGFAPGATPTAVETFSILDNVCGTARQALLHGPEALTHVQFHPTPRRLMVVYCPPRENGVQVWDTQGPKTLLHHQDSSFYPETAFSPDGRFFACHTTGSEVYLWKGSPTGFTPHQKFTVGTPYSTPLLSPNGELIILLDGPLIRLWRTKILATASTSTFTRAPQQTEDFLLEFLANRSFAVIARKKDTFVTVLDLESGLLWLTIDTDMEVYGLRAVGSEIVVIGANGVSTWDVPEGDFLPDARMTIEDSTRITALLRTRPWDEVIAGSASPDSGYVALTEYGTTLLNTQIYSASTGRHLGRVEGGTTLWFAPGGHDVWVVNGRDRAKVFRITPSGRAEKILEGDLKHLVQVTPWRSTRGYEFTDDGWILGPDGKRLLMLPPSWRSEMVQRVWNGQFLALLNGVLSEPVILGLEL